MYMLLIRSVERRTSDPYVTGSSPVRASDSRASFMGLVRTAEAAENIVAWMTLSSCLFGISLSLLTVVFSAY